MGKIRYSGRLLAQFVRFAVHHRAYWIVPLIILLALLAITGVSVQSAAPLLYTLF